MTKTAYIYFLLDPDTNQVRYIGKSIRPKERLQNHMNEVSNCHRSHWLQFLKAQGKKPVLEVVEAVKCGESWQKRERYWIKHGKDQGWPLTNNTNGGDGVDGLSKEARERVRKTWLGRKHRPETLIKLSQASKGRLHSEEWKRDMSEKMKNREITWGPKLSKAVAKFSTFQQSIIRYKLAHGAKVKDLAEYYGVHRTTISKIKNYQYMPKSTDQIKEPKMVATLPEWLLNN